MNVSTTCPQPDFLPEGHFMRIPVNDTYSEKLIPYFPQAFNFLGKFYFLFIADFQIVWQYLSFKENGLVRTIFIKYCQSLYF